MHFSLGGKSQGVWWLGFLVFIPAPQVQVPGRELDVASRHHSLLPLRDHHCEVILLVLKKLVLHLTSFTIAVITFKTVT